MSYLSDRFRIIGNVFVAVKNFVQFFWPTSINQSNALTPTVSIRQGVLLELRVMDYPKFVGSALHSVRLPFKPLHLFKIECTDSLARETLTFFADLTAQNEGAIAGMPVTVRSRRHPQSSGLIEHTVTLD